MLLITPSLKGHCEDKMSCERARTALGTSDAPSMGGSHCSRKMCGRQTPPAVSSVMQRRQLTGTCRLTCPDQPSRRARWIPPAVTQGALPGKWTQVGFSPAVAPLLGAFVQFTDWPLPLTSQRNGKSHWLFLQNVPRINFSSPYRGHSAGCLLYLISGQSAQPS